MTPISSIFIMEQSLISVFYRSLGLTDIVITCHQFSKTIGQMFQTKQEYFLKWSCTLYVFIPAGKP